MVCTLTRIVKFTATHHYALPGLSGQENEARFGRTARPHQHAYECAVTVRGTPDPKTGMIGDLTGLDRVLQKEVLDRYDGRDLNADHAFSGGTRLPACESLCQDIWDRLAPQLAHGLTLTCVRVQENPALYAEYRAD